MFDNWFSKYYQFESVLKKGISFQHHKVKYAPNTHNID